MNSVMFEPVVKVLRRFFIKMNSFTKIKSASKLHIRESREILLNNYIVNDIKKLFYPFYLLPYMFLSIKFIIRDNFIYPNGRKLNIAMSIFWTVLFIVFIFRIFTTYDEVVEYYPIRSKTERFLTYFYTICDSCGIIVVFILNVIHNYNNVLVILYIQEIHESFIMDQKINGYSTIWIWISSLVIICVEALSIVLSYVLDFYFYLDHAVIDYLLIIFDCNLIYAIQIITLLKIYLIKFKNNYLLINSTKDCDDIFKIYKTFMRAYTLLKRISNFMVILCIIIT